ncbi:protein-disulfide reductase DsbD family protein [Elioraea sp.]|uniref:protein-disulfide reductase DsbD family protein n=1 Tax=Elioraea sp. TaxID=2185103 RepID=UPI003F713585
MSSHTLRRLVFGAALLVSVQGPASATSGGVAETERVRAELLADVAAIAPGKTFRIGLDLAMARDWHTYWRNPGDSGMATEIALDLPEGWRTDGIAWPAPERLPYGTLVNFGFHDRVTLPVTVHPPRDLAPGSTITLRAEASWLVCKDVCIPEEAVFTLTLPVAATPVPARPETLARFTEAERRRPGVSPFAARIEDGGPRVALVLAGAGRAQATLREAVFFPHDWGVIDHSEIQTVRREGGDLRIEMVRGEAGLGERIAGVVTLAEAAPDGVLTTAFTIDAPVAPAPPPGTLLPFWQALLFAFAGGLILNLMPCVFPVLSMKALALVRLGAGARSEVRAHTLSYTAGVLVSFGLIAVALLALRAGGIAAGWGFQFQSPVFVALVAWVLFAVGLSLSGVFHVGGRLAGAGQSLAMRGGHGGSFFTGVLAVIVATPCTAPFMGAAVGFAVTAPPAVLVSVMVAMGLGLAAPYALIAAVPSLAGLMPRPGAWMERLKQAMAFPMYASAVWLVWVLSQQTGPSGVLVALAGMVLIAFAAWAWEATRDAGRGWRRTGTALAGAAAIAMLALVPRLEAALPTQTRCSEAAGPATAEPYSAARLAALRDDGRPVFVNMTAAWCITCLVNERTSLATGAVQRAFAERGIAYLSGDWTRQDPAITDYLRRFGRSGVPIYVFYPAGGGDPVVLPQILTEAIVLNALGAAGG